MCYFTFTGIIHEEGAIVRSAEPLMAEPVTVFDGSYIVENMGFYKEEIERANKERMLAEMDARKRILPDREKGIPYVNKSPFLRRGVDINEDTSKDDNRIWDYIRNDEGLMYMLHGDSSRKETMKINLELLYRSSADVDASRRMFKTLSAGALVIDRIIDCWAEVLNYEEQFRALGSTNRLFMGTRVVFEWMLLDQKMHREKRMDRFRKNMQGGMHGNTKLFDLRSFDMVLFPILEAGHYYLLVFEMKNPAITLIDNGAENLTRLVIDSDVYINKSVPYKYVSTL
ncbi:putative papain-like cysteine peptidase superfamily [Helianthus annuus]|nr:putative papain-like cysteine peptidase superfamily [Helianthus annuus]